MRQHKLAGIACVGFLLICGTPRTTSQDQQQNPPDPSTETGAYQVAHNESDAQTKIKLLDDFAAQFPESAQMPDVLRDYYQAYFAIENYPRSIEYADELIALGDKVDVDSRILALVDREVAYSVGCSAAVLRTPEAYTKARDAGKQGLEMLAQWQKPDYFIQEQFDAGKKSFSIILEQVAGMGERGLAGLAVDCPAPRQVQGPARTPYDRRNFDQMINDIKEQERQSPRVR